MKLILSLLLHLHLLLCMIFGHTFGILHFFCYWVFKGLEYTVHELERNASWTYFKIQSLNDDKQD